MSDIFLDILVSDLIYITQVEKCHHWEYKSKRKFKFVIHIENYDMGPNKQKSSKFHNFVCQQQKKKVQRHKIILISFFKNERTQMQNHNNKPKVLFQE